MIERMKYLHGSKYSDHKIIWLSPACDDCDPERLWCDDDVFDPCEDCGRGSSKFIFGGCYRTGRKQRNRKDQS